MVDPEKLLYRWAKNKNIFQPLIKSKVPPAFLKRYRDLKIHIEPENDGLEDDVPFPGVYSQVPC